MVTRRPLVRITGKTRQLPAGDVLAGIEQRFPVYQANSNVAVVLIDMVVKAEGAVLPVHQTSGNVVEVPL